MIIQSSTKPNKVILEIDEKNLVYHRRLEHFLCETKSPRLRTIKGLLVGSTGKGGPQRDHSN